MVEDPTTGTVDCCFEHECQIPILTSVLLPGTTPDTEGVGPPRSEGPIHEGMGVMEVVHQRCAGLDVSKRDAKVCVRSPGRRQGSYTKTVTTFGSVTAEILRLREHLTSIFRALADRGCRVWLPRVCVAPSCF